MLKFSCCFGLKPSSLTKLQENKNVSKYLTARFQAIFDQQINLETVLLDSPRVKKIIKIHQLYQITGNLEKVGREYGVSRERIRQLLIQGDKLGLFRYRKKSLLAAERLSREKILEDYSGVLRLTRVARMNQISPGLLKKILSEYQISRDELKAIRTEKGKAESVRKYISIVEQIGHHPSSSELQREKEGRYLTTKINRLWGSIRTFRQELGIEKINRKQRTLLLPAV